MRRGGDLTVVVAVRVAGSYLPRQIVRDPANPESLLPVAMLYKSPGKFLR